MMHEMLKYINIIIIAYMYRAHMHRLECQASSSSMMLLILMERINRT